MSLAKGTRLGHYEVLELIGAGGMGDVYKALDMRLDRIRQGSALALGGQAGTARAISARGQGDCQPPASAHLRAVRRGDEGFAGRARELSGDGASGERLFAADLAAMKMADDRIPRTVAPIEEIQLCVLGADGTRIYVTLHELIEATMGATVVRADLHISRSRDGELFITSRQDGTIRMLVPDSE